MADSLTSSVRINFKATLVATLTNSVSLPQSVVESNNLFSFTDGTSANNADKLWASKSRSLSGSTSEDIDLYDLGSIDIGAGAGNDPLGQSVTLAEVVAVVVFNDSSSTGTLTIGGKGTTAAWNSAFNSDDDAACTVKPGGFFAIGSPTDPAYAVADTSNHLLTMASSDDLTYDIYVLGRSA